MRREKQNQKKKRTVQSGFAAEGSLKSRPEKIKKKKKRQHSIGEKNQYLASVDWYRHSEKQKRNRSVAGYRVETLKSLLVEMRGVKKSWNHQRGDKTPL